MFLYLCRHQFLSDILQCQYCQQRLRSEWQPTLVLLVHFEFALTIFYKISSSKALTMVDLPSSTADRLMHCSSVYALEATSISL